ncbi:required for drug-induced death protein 1 [Spea bombifrons]|uniref:required for drug-induced death protein 1 n=1 Tax=Spea bombifrons TaxID=233779 RepID=UPI0023495E78|nr:required for drug-induced death protein 1 [Spea bombifrons]
MRKGRMAGGSKLRGKKKNKYGKLPPEEDQGTPLQERDRVSSPQQEPSEQPTQCKAPKGKKKRSRKKVHLSPLPDRYDPLEEGVEEAESKEDKKYKRKQKVKKYAKNMGKAVRTGCRYLLIGIQGLANAYIAPFGVSSVVISSMTR